MRKCHLCGSVLRRRAEFCRFCTARQPGAQTEHPSGVATGPPPGGPPWMVPAPPETEFATTSAHDAPSPASFEPIWDAVAGTRRPESPDEPRERWEP